MTRVARPRVADTRRLRGQSHPKGLVAVPTPVLARLGALSDQSSGILTPNPVPKSAGSCVPKLRRLFGRIASRKAARRRRPRRPRTRAPTWPRKRRTAREVPPPTRVGQARVIRHSRRPPAPALLRLQMGAITPPRPQNKRRHAPRAKELKPAVSAPKKRRRRNADPRARA